MTTENIAGGCLLQMKKNYAISWEEKLQVIFSIEFLKK